MRSAAAAGRDVAARLNFLAPDWPPGAAVRTWSYDPPDGGPRFNASLQSQAVTVRDGRPRRDHFSLAEQGFTLCDHTSAVLHWWDVDELRRVHFDEAAALARQLTGAREAIVFDHTLRRRAPHKPPLDGSGGSFAAVREPVGRVHADYTPWSGPQRLRQVLGDERASAVQGRRFAILGLWRPLLDTALRDAPLALADGRSVAAADLVVNELIYPDRRGETFIGRHAAAQRWHYFSDQRRDEVIAFWHFRPDALPTPHSAFDDPAAPADAPARESLELRVLLLF